MAGRTRHLVAPVRLLYVGAATGTTPGVPLDPLAGVVFLKGPAEVGPAILGLHAATSLHIQSIVGRLENIQVLGEDPARGYPVPRPLAEHAEGQLALGAHDHVGALVPHRGAAAGGAGTVHHVTHGVQRALEEELLVPG